MGKHIQENDLKTVNGQSLLGEGDLNIEGGGSSIELNDEQFYKGEDGKYKIGYGFTFGETIVKVDGFKNLNSLNNKLGVLCFGNYYEYSAGIVNNGTYLILGDDPANSTADFMMHCSGVGQANGIGNVSGAAINIKSTEHQTSFSSSCSTGSNGIEVAMLTNKITNKNNLKISVSDDIYKKPADSSTTISITNEETKLSTSLQLSRGSSALPALSLIGSELIETPIDGAIERGEDGRLYTSYGGGRHKLVEEQDLDTKVEELTAIIADLQRQIEELKKS